MTEKVSGEVCPGSSSNSGVVIKTSLSSGVKGSIELPGKGSVENDIGVCISLNWLILYWGQQLKS